MNVSSPGSLESKSIFQHSILNLVTQGCLLVVALGTLPILTTHLGESQFGLLSILWAFVGYFSLLDLGTSRALTRLVSVSLGKGDFVRARRAMWAGVSFGAMMGVGMALLLIVAGPFLESIFATADIVQAGSIDTAFHVTAIGIPFMIIFGGVNGIFIAHQKFIPVNAFRTITALLQWGGAAVLVLTGYGVLEIIILTVGVRIIIAALAFVSLYRLIPEYFEHIQFWDRKEVAGLLSFGGWITVSQVISPAFLYVDRFLIGSMLSMSAVAFYTVPQEALARLSIIPTSLTTTLFPAFSQGSAENEGSRRWEALYERSLLHLFHLMLPIVFLFVVFASPILNVWVGTTYSENSTLVFQIIAVGILFNTLAQIPVAGIHALGRADITAKLHLIELPIMVALNLAVIPMFGIKGVAMVWSARVVSDAVALEVVMRRFASTKGWGIRSNLFVDLLLFAIIAFVILMLQSFEARLVAAIGSMTVYAFVVWRWRLDDQERNGLKRIFHFLRR